MTLDPHDSLLGRDWGDVWESLPEAPPLLPRPKTAQVTLRMPTRLLARIKAVAAAKTLPYHALVRAWIIEALRTSAPPANSAMAGEPHAEQLNIKLDSDTLDRLKLRAHELRRPYHRLAREWIEVALAREEESLGIDAKSVGRPSMAPTPAFPPGPTRTSLQRQSHVVEPSVSAGSRRGGRDNAGVGGAPPESLNMNLLAHLDLAGHGNGGEGIALHAAGGRRTLYIAHESAPVDLSIVDVTDPRRPELVDQRLLPHAEVRSNSLHVSQGLMAVAYQTQRAGMQPAGVAIFDLGDPRDPRRVGWFDTSGPHSRGAHFVWFVDRTVWTATGMPDFQPANPKDDQIVVALDVSDPAKPREAGRWWLPGTRVGDAHPAPVRHPRFDAGHRAHNINVYPDHPSRAYVGYIDGGVVILDIADPSRMRQVGGLDYHPPLPGFTHTVLPLFGRGLLAVTDEAVRPLGEDHPKHLWLMDASSETNIVPISAVPPPPAEFKSRGGVYGTHNIHENDPVPTALHSETTLVGAFFNGGVRAFDITDPYRPELTGSFVPPAPSTSRAGAIQMNDVYVDETGLIYAVDRLAGGLYILEFTAWA